MRIVALVSGSGTNLQAVLDAVDLALVHRCTPAVYRWAPAHALTDAA